MTGRDALFLVIGGALAVGVVVAVRHPAEATAVGTVVLALVGVATLLLQALR